MHHSAILVLAAALCFQGDPDVEARGGVPVPGGIVDAASGIAYLGDLERGIVALDASDGELRWESRDASRPLALHQGHLLAWRHGSSSFSIAVLDAATGRLIRESAAVPLGSTGPISGVETHAWLTEKTLNVHWRVVRQPHGGACRDEGRLGLFARGSAVAMDLETAEVEALPGEGPTPSFELEGATPVDELPDDVRDLARRERWEHAVVAAGQVYGRSTSVTAKSSDGPARRIHEVHVFDLTSQRLVWRGPYEQRALPPPDWMLQP